MIIKTFMSIVIILFVTSAFAVERMPIAEVSIDKILEDTQSQPPEAGDNHIALVWWVPLEYWQSIFARDDSISEVQKKALLESLGEISLLAIVQADITMLGAFEFYSKKEVENNLAVSFIDSTNKQEGMQPMQKLDSDLEILLGQIVPILGAAMGNMGNNFHFFVFNDLAESKQRLLDPYSKSTLKVQLKKKTGELMSTSVEMPLNSLFIPRVCPNGKEAHVSWKYCPWSGEKLAP